MLFIADCNYAGEFIKMLNKITQTDFSFAILAATSEN
jgi:hypothetical protein